MGIKLKLPGGSVVSYAKTKTSVSSKANYGLTPLGKVKAEEGELAGARGRVLGAVQSLSFSTPSEIATEANLPIERVKQVLKVLIKRGFVQQEQEEI